MDEIPVTDDLLARHVAGESSLDEDQAIAMWVEASDANREEYERLLTAWQTRPPAAPVDVDAGWNRVSAQLHAEDRTPDVIPIPSRPRWPTTLLRLAAAIVVVAGAGYAWTATRGTPEPTVYTTAAAERLEVTLADGSTIVLAPRSTLTVPGDFGGRGREVELVGEAWFSVTHAEGSTLSVRTPTHVVRDIGTVFTVAARAGSLVRVAVIEGEVGVRGVEDPVDAERRLVAGDVARFGLGEPKVTSGMPTDSLDMWHHGILDVNDARVGDVLADLATWYGTPFFLGDTTLASRTITGTFSLDSLPQALDVLGLLLEVTPSREDSGIVFR